MLLLAAQFVETGKTRVAEQMPDEMGAASILPEERENLRSLWMEKRIVP